MSSNITLPVGSEQEGQRIDKFLQESLPGMSRSQAQTLMDRLENML